ncbi:MAG: hypothetical protein KatS3mg115_2531 [Candidatus Poribacteria bacterium]|nr:MAG: hypothetical protein KatS3mg115_2531 [Candidatus Poribacteria bacterium]
MSGRNGQVEDLSGWLEPIRERHETPALAGACLREGRLVGLGATGRRRLDADVPVSAGDRFHLGSCTKAMTATLTGVLVEESRLSWGDHPGGGLCRACSLGSSGISLGDRCRSAEPSQRASGAGDAGTVRVSSAALLEL